MSIPINILCSDLPASITVPLERRIRQIISEPPENLSMVKVHTTDLFKRSALAEEVFGEVYRITLCDQEGERLSGEREFLLFQTRPRSLFLLRYIKLR